MGLVRNVTKNALAMGTVQIVAQLSTFVLSIFLARYLGSQNYGTYTLAFSLSTLIFIIADFNLGLQMVVEVAPNKQIASGYLTNSLVLRAIVCVVSILVTFVVALALNLPGDVTFAIIIIALATAFNWMYKTFTAVYTTFEMMHYVLWTAIAERAFTVGIAIALLLLGFGLEAVVLVVLFGAILQFILAYLVCSKYVVLPTGRPDMQEIGQQMKRAVPYGISDLAINSLYSINAVLVQLIVVWMGGSANKALTSVAMYNLPFNMVTALVALPTVLIVALLPVISRMYQSSKEMTQLTQQKVMKYMFALGLPLAVGGMIMAGKIVLFFYGSEYSPAVAVFTILAPAIAISFFDSGMGSILASAKLIRLITVANGIGAILNVVLCFVFIPFFQQEGAAMAFTIGYFILTAVTFYFLTKYVFRVDLVDIMVRPGMAAAGMGLVLLLLPGLNLFISLGLGAAIYFALLFVLKGINQEDKEILLKILKKEA